RLFCTPTHSLHVNRKPENRSIEAMEYWQRAKTFAEEAAKKTQTLTSPARIADIVSETAKRSKEFAAEASKKADEIKSLADQGIKSLADQIPSSLSLLDSPPPPPQSEHSLRSSRSSASPTILESSFVDSRPAPSSISLIKERCPSIAPKAVLSMYQINSNSKLFICCVDDSVISDVPTVSNVRQDLTEWQQKHASIVLTTVQQISRLRYELCPRHMKDAKFWRIYFTLVSTHVAPYEKQYMEEAKLKEEQNKDDKSKQTSIDGDPHSPGVMVTKQKSLTSTSSTAEQDLDTFLLGDLEDGDGGADDGDEAFDDDFDKIGNSDVEDEPKFFKALSAGCLADLRKVSIHVSFIAYDVKTECLSCFVYLDSVNSLLPYSRKVYQYEMFEIRSNN
ncbi:hypothetical protein C3L33_16970, partial [Rhododendron williamsianum]